jgi:hypothetical protein
MSEDLRFIVLGFSVIVDNYKTNINLFFTIPKLFLKLFFFRLNLGGCYVEVVNIGNRKHRKTQPLQAVWFI